MRKKHRKFSARIFSFALVAALLCTMIPTGVMAAEDEPATGNRQSQWQLNKSKVQSDESATETLYFKGDGKLYIGTNAASAVEFAQGGWSAEGTTLTLKNFTFKTSSGFALDMADGTALKLEGENQISGLDTGVRGEGALAISGTGSLKVEGVTFGIYTVKDLAVSESTITATKPTMAINASTLLSISKSAKIVASSTSAVVGASDGITISGSTVNATSTGDCAIRCAEGTLSITNNSKITANGSTCGLLSQEKMMITDSQVLATSKTDNAMFTEAAIDVKNSQVEAEGGAFCALHAKGNIMLSGGKITAKSAKDSAIFTPQDLTVEKNAIVKATAKYRALQSSGKMRLEGKIDATSEESIAIRSGNLMELDDTDIHAVGAAGFPAIAVLYTQAGETDPPVMIKLLNGAETLEVVKPAASDWFSSGRDHKSYTAFIPKDQSKLEIDGTGMPTNGVGEITVKSAYVPPEPTPVYLTSISIEKAPAKTEYTEGEMFDKTGMQIMANYSNGSKFDVTASCAMKPEGPLAITDKEIIIAYASLTAKQPITVSSAKPEKATIKTPPAKCQYDSQETFHPEGLVVEVTYSNGKKEDIIYSNKTREQFTFQPALDKPLTTADKQVTIQYEGITMEQPITVLTKGTEGIKLRTPAVKATAGSTSANLSWKGIKGADGYQIYRSTSAKGTYGKIKITGKTAFTDSGLTTGKTYYYKVRAYSKASNTTGYSSFSKIVSAVPRTAAPTFKLTAGSKKIIVQWKAVKGADGYVIYRGNSKNGTYKKLTVRSKKATKYTSLYLQKNKTYYYKMSSYKVVKGKKVYSKISSAVSKTAK